MFVVWFEVEFGGVPDVVLGLDCLFVFGERHPGDVLLLGLEGGLAAALLQVDETQAQQEREIDHFGGIFAAVFAVFGVGEVGSVGDGNVLVVFDF